MKPTYDVFISHASEDKDVAGPLAASLERFGVRLWYDEYSLEVGDSLSESIDAGLRGARFGIVILSRHFFAKPWARRELAGLVAKEIASGKTILPIWHGVVAAEVRELSPTLADKVALTTANDDIEVIGLKILRVVRPDIFENIQRWILWKKMLRDAKPVLTKLSDLKPSPRRHETLPHAQLVRTRIIHQILGDVVHLTYDEMVDVFCRDVHPLREIEIWERIASAFAAVMRAEALSDGEKDIVFSALLGLSTSGPVAAQQILSEGNELELKVLHAWADLIPKSEGGDA